MQSVENHPGSGHRPPTCGGGRDRNPKMRRRKHGNSPDHDRPRRRLRANLECSGDPIDLRPPTRSRPRSRRRIRRVVRQLGPGGTSQPSGGQTTSNSAHDGRALAGRPLRSPNAARRHRCLPPPAGISRFCRSSAGSAALAATSIRTTDWPAAGNPCHPGGGLRTSRPPIHGTPRVRPYPSVPSGHPDPLGSHRRSGASTCRHRSRHGSASVGRPTHFFLRLPHGSGGFFR